jgi:uncharacterized protein (TIGR02266 family)
MEAPILNEMDDVQDNLMEFAELNRRRLFGCPPLDMPDLARWQELQGTLVKRFQVDPGGGKRMHERLPTHLHVEMVAGDVSAKTTGPSMNLSEGGIFLATTSLLEVGTQLQLYLASSERTVEVQGVVAWTRSEGTDEGPPGMGVRFTEMENSQRSHIEQILDTKRAELRKSNS